MNYTRMIFHPVTQGVNLFRNKIIQSITFAQNKGLMPIKRTLFVLCILFFFTLSCEKFKQPNIPYIPIDLVIYPNSMDYISPGGYKYFNAGYRGILVYRILPDQFMVFERCCPYDPEKAGAQIKVDHSVLTATDSVCNYKFNMLDGTPISGPSNFALVQYRFSYDGDALHIYN